MRAKELTIYSSEDAMPASVVLFLGGVYKLELFLPEEYPMAAPKVTAHPRRACCLSRLLG